MLIIGETLNKHLQSTYIIKWIEMNILCILFSQVKNIGAMAEWFKAAVLKTVVRPRTGGSNPSRSAINPNFKFQSYN